MLAAKSLSRMLRPRSPEDLAGFRIATAIAALVAVSPMAAAHFSCYPEELCFPPGVFGARIGRIRVEPWWVWTLYALFVPFAVATLVGWKSRLSALGLLVTATILLGVPQFFGKIVHYNHIVWFAMLLPISPCGDAWSLDARRRGEPRPQPHAAYALPLLVATVLIGLAYFFPGVWKLIDVGAAWCEGDNMAQIIRNKWIQFHPESVRGRLGWLRIDLSMPLCAAVAWATIAFELLFLPLALWRRTRLLAVGIGLAFHLGIYVVMGINIGHLAFGYAALVPWGRLAGAEDGGRNQPGARPTRVYRPWPVVVVGALLILGNIHNGVLRRDDWPFGCYPTFATRAGPITTMLEIEAELADGTRLVLTEAALGRYTEPSRARALGGILLGEPPGSTARLEALWKVWECLEPRLADATRVRWYRVQVRTDPDAPEPIVSRALLHELTPRP